MTIPNQCQELGIVFRQCIDSCSILDKITGKCDVLKKQFDDCVDEQVRFYLMSRSEFSNVFSFKEKRFKMQKKPKKELENGKKQIKK